MIPPARSRRDIPAGLAQGKHDGEWTLSRRGESHVDLRGEFEANAWRLPAACDPPSAISRSWSAWLFRPVTLRPRLSVGFALYEARVEVAFHSLATIRRISAHAYVIFHEPRAAADERRSRADRW